MTALKSKCEDKVFSTMDIYERPYYKLAKSFASFIGQWPYQSRFQRLVLEFLLWNLFIIQVVPQVVIQY